MKTYDKLCKVFGDNFESSSYLEKANSFEKWFLSLEDDDREDLLDWATIELYRLIYLSNKKCEEESK